MATTTKFSVATHIAAVLACCSKERLCSEDIARSVNANPVVVRTILCALSEAGLVEGRLGKHGGSRLTRPAAQISLADIWKAVEDPDLFSIHRYPENSCCQISCGLKERLREVANRASAALTDELRTTSLAEFVRPMVDEPTPARKRTSSKNRKSRP